MTGIRERKKAGSKYGILLEKSVVSEAVKIEVKTPETAKVEKVVVYDNLGNVVFEGGNTWNLKNKAGRDVANGTYLVVTEVTGVSGKTYMYNAKIGVRR